MSAEQGNIRESVDAANKRFILLSENNGLTTEQFALGFPWKHDSVCYNFNFPKEVITKEEIADIDYDNIVTLVIGCDLDDYSFISQMDNLKQLYIYVGDNLDNISFVTE